MRTPLLLLVGAVLVASFVGACTQDDAASAPSGAAAESAPDGGTAVESDVRAFAALSPAVLPSPPPDPTNMWADDPRAAELGQRFFFDPGFSGPLLDSDNNGLPPALGNVGDTGKVACASCHVPSAGFTDSRSPRGQISLAAGWTPRRTRSLLDVGHAKLLMWDGRRDAIWNQVFGPIETAFEMNSSRLFVAQRIAKTPAFRSAYEAIFGAMPAVDDPAQFPQLAAKDAGCNAIRVADGLGEQCRGGPGDGGPFDGLTEANKDAVTRIVVNVGKSVEAYLRRLSCGPSRFDAYVHGDAAALTAEEQRGARLFVGKARCVRCHSGPRFTDEGFHNVGLAPSLVAQFFIDRDDRGAAVGVAKLLADPLSTRGIYADVKEERAPASVPPSWEGAFRTPSLRCVPKRRSFTHTGQFRTLTDVVDFFSRGGEASGYPGTSELTPVNLSPEEITDIVAFLKALDGPGPQRELLEPLP